MDAGDTLLTEESTSTSEVARFDSDCSTNPLLKFMTTDEYELQTVRRQKTPRDPMSHRIIEKRRRDRMNNCLADLSRLIPTSYLKQGQGRIEKTEIIEMAIKHIRILQSQADNKSESKMPPRPLKDAMCGEGDGKTSEYSCCKKQFFLGFKECQDEVMRFLVEGEAMSATDPLCLRIIDHLNAAGRHFEVALNNETTKIQTETGGQLNMPSYYSGSLSRTLLSGSTIDPLLPLPPNPATAGIIGHACSLQDKHLCNLLSPQGLQEIESDQEYTHQSQGALPTGSVCCSEINMLGSQTVTVSQVTSHVPAFSGPSLGVEESICGGIISTENSLNGGVSSGYVSDVSCLEKNQNTSADHSGVASHLISCKENAINIYKFKHNITKRFSQEGKVILQHTYDGSSSTSSRECEEEVPGTCSLRHRSARGKSRYASTSDSGPYPSSDHSYSHERSKCFNSDVRISVKENSGNSGLEERSDRCKNQFCKGSNHSITFMGQKFEQCSRTALPLPGFVLHPSGTHYMPMSVCYANFPDIFETMETTPGPPVFHPISIPVHFHGPVISLPTNVCTHSQSEDTAECLKISADPDVKHFEVKDTKGIRK